MGRREGGVSTYRCHLLYGRLPGHHQARRPENRPRSPGPCSIAGAGSGAVTRELRLTSESPDRRLRRGHRPSRGHYGLCMALHTRRTLHDEVNDALFASRGLRYALPKSEFPEASSLPPVAYQAIHDELLLDGNARQNLATFCQTWE